MRSRAPFLAALLTFGAVIVPQLAHAAIPFFGPIIPDAYNQCPAGWGLVIPVINNIIELALTIAIVFIAPIMIAYAGFLYVVNSVDPSGLGRARSILLNTIVGVVIALAGWLIVDAVLTALTNQGVSYWSQLISTGGASPCLDVSGALSNSGGTGGGQSGVSATGAPTYLLSNNGDCSVSSLDGALAGSAYADALTPAQVETLSCIALPESSCGANTTGATTPNGTPTYALGMFQIVPGYNDTCHNLNIPACSQAAGVSGNLNCTQAFHCVNSSCTIVNQTLWQECQTAGANLDCNTQAAACLVEQDGGTFSDWTGDSRSSAQAQCVQEFASGG